MSDTQGENGSGKKRRSGKPRLAGGFALVEVLQEGADAGKLDILTVDLAGQKECREALRSQIENGSIKADGKRIFGIIQIKVKDLVPLTTTAVKF